MTERVTKSEFARLAGCDEKQVRRAIAAGKLSVDTRGRLDPADVHSAWRRPRIDSRATPPLQGADMGTTSAVTVPTYESTNPAFARYRSALAHKADFAGRLAELEFRTRQSELIELRLARQVLSQSFQGARSAWLRWPERVAAAVARDLGLSDVARVAELLSQYVKTQLASLGEPTADFLRRADRA